MDISPTGQGQQPSPSDPNDLSALLRMVATTQAQTNEMLRQLMEVQRQQLELIRESTQVAREQRARQSAELERWQKNHGNVLDRCKTTLSQLEQVHSSLLEELSDYVTDYHDNLLEGDFALADFVDRFGPRLAHLNTMLSVLRPLAATQQQQPHPKKSKRDEK